MKALTVALAMPLLVVACASFDGVGGSATLGPSSSDSTPPGATPPPLNNRTVPVEMFNAMVDDAAARASVDRSAVTVVEASSVTWSDGSLGCPEPGKFYTQALVPGYRVVLEAGGSTYDYHASQRGGFNLCPRERAKPPVEGAR